jgi:hypothetical protein
MAPESVLQRGLRLPDSTHLGRHPLGRVNAGTALLPRWGWLVSDFLPALGSLFFSCEGLPFFEILPAYLHIPWFTWYLSLGLGFLGC